MFTLSRKSLIIIFSSVAVLAVVVIGLLVYGVFTKTPTTSGTGNNETERQALSDLINQTTGATINGEGYEISYLDTEQIFVLTALDNPFQGNIEKAKEYIREKGIDINNLKFICSVVRSVNATEEEVTKCGNAVIK